MRILTKSEKIELISKKVDKVTKGVTWIDDNIYIRKKERIMTQNNETDWQGMATFLEWLLSEKSEKESEK